MVLPHERENHGGFPRWFSVGKSPRKKWPVTQERNHGGFRRDFSSRPRKSSGTKDFCMIIPSRGTSHGISRANQTIFQCLWLVNKKSPRKSAVIFPRVAEMYTLHGNISRRISSVHVMTEKSLKIDQIHSWKRILHLLGNPPWFSLSCGRTIRQHNIRYEMYHVSWYKTSTLQASDHRSRETEFEKEASLEKNRLQAADGRAQETQKEKEACFEKIAFEAPFDVWIKRLSNDDTISNNCT